MTAEPPDPTDLACELLERAKRARDAGKPKAALQDARRSLAIFLRHDGPRSGDAANVLIEISATEHELGHYDAALKAAERAWRIVGPARSRDEVVRRLRMIVLAQLSVVHVARGEYARARRASVRALALAERLGSEEVLGAAMGLGVACKHAGRYEEAERAYERVGASLGRKPSLVRATLLHNLGGLAHARGRFAEGVKHARRGLALREKLVGRDHPDVASDLAALAALLDAAGYTREAALAYKRALRIYEKAFGPRHVEVGFVAANLAALEHGRGRLREAERLYRRGLSVLARTLGDSHPYVAMANHNLGLLRLVQGHVRDAERLLQRAVRAATENLGRQHPDTICFREDLDSVLAQEK